MLVTAIVLAIIVALLEHFFGIADPWRKIVIIGIAVLFVLGLIQLLIPGFLPLATRWP